MIYVIDHEDSFTYNLVHLLEGFAPTYVSNYYDINWRQLEKSKIIIFSPGPGNPSNYPETQKVYNKYKGKKKNYWYLPWFSANIICGKCPYSSSKKNISWLSV